MKYKGTIDGLLAKLNTIKQTYREAYAHMIAHGTGHTFTPTGAMITREDCYKVLNITPIYEE